MTRKIIFLEAWYPGRCFEILKTTYYRSMTLRQFDFSFSNSPHACNSSIIGLFDLFVHILVDTILNFLTRAVLIWFFPSISICENICLHIFHSHKLILTRKEKKNYTRDHGRIENWKIFATKPTQLQFKTYSNLGKLFKMVTPTCYSFNFQKFTVPVIQNTEKNWEKNYTPSCMLRPLL